MTRLKSLAVGGAAAALIMTGAISQSFAVESGTFNYLPGASIGIPAGAAAPPGIYTGFEQDMLFIGGGGQGGVYGNQAGTGPGGALGAHLGAYVGIVPIVWSTGLNFLGANYSVAVIQPFTTPFVGAGGSTGSCANLGVGPLCVWQQMFINTVWQPLNLSWNLGHGLFASIAFSFQGPDGSQYAGVANPDYWTYQPGAAISYLDANWLLSANFAYLIYGPSKGIASNLGGTAFGSGYTNGQEFTGDFTFLYKVGKWSFGPVGYVNAQTTNDRAGGGGCAALAASAAFGGFGCGRQLQGAAGALVGYNFGPVDIQVWFTDQFINRDTVGGGAEFWTRVGFRLWGPEAPKPLVAKN
jgi:hypothetical protein